MDRLKDFLIKSVVLFVNAALVVGGVFFVKSQQEKKQAQDDLATNTDINQGQQALAEQAKQLEQIVQQNKNQKTDGMANNTGTVTVQKPVTVTQTIPAKTKTETVSVPVSSSSSSSSSSPAPAKTTKKS